MKKLILTILPGVIFTASSHAVIIGTEAFDTDGLIADQTGGSGFDYDYVNGTTTGTTSDWDNVGGAPSVVGGALVTNNSSAKREYNGPTEGSGGGDGADTERAGAARGNGVVFYSVELTRSAGATWSGISSYDFGSEKIFFGVTTGASGTDTIGISETGVSETTGLISLVDGRSYNLVAVVDFDNNGVGLFINPDGINDFWDTSDGSNNADVYREFTGTNWSTAARLGSGGGEATWDNLMIGRDNPIDVGLLAANPVPEPSSALLGGLALLGLIRRRR
ncbi:PEP-CTERM sorting domain-containing protein [Verrucomicrobiaceae bacterium 227]